jgi:uncharacterized protein Yka (UPF0111/DUF47 family)
MSDAFLKASGNEVDGMDPEKRRKIDTATRAELLDYVGKVDPAMVRWMKNNTMDELREVVHELEAIGEATEDMEKAVEELGEAEHEVEILKRQHAVHAVVGGHVDGPVEVAEG